MKEFIGLLILAAIVLGLTAVALYYILRKIAEKQFLSGPVDVLNLFFPGTGGFAPPKESTGRVWP